MSLPQGNRSNRDNNRYPLLAGISYLSASTLVQGTFDPATGAQLVSIASGSSSDTQYAEGSTTAPGTGNLSLGRYKATPPSLTDGQLYGLQLDTSGNLKVTGSLSVGGTTDNSSFTAGTSTGTPTMGFYHSTIDAVTDGRAAAVAITANRAQHSNLRNASGTEVGTASTPLQVSIANTGANATAVKVDGSAVTQPVSGTFWQATQPVSGTVTANAGTNLNTSALALESGGNLDDIDAALDASVIAQEATTSGTKGITAYGAVTTSKPTYTTAKSDALSLDTNGLLRVSLVDTPANTNKFLVTPDSVALPANQSVNVSQINGVTPLMGNGVTGTGSQRVTIASDNTAFAVNATLQAGANTIGAISNTSFTASNTAGDVASGSSDSGNPVKQGAVAHTAAPTAVTDGQRVNLIADKVGKQVVVGSIRDLKGNQFTTITSSTSETTVVTQVASTFLDVYGCIIENTSATASKVTFKDSTAGTTQFEIYVPAGDTRGFMLPESGAFKQTTVNTNWTATCGTSVASIVISMLYVKNI